MKASEASGLGQKLVRLLEVEGVEAAYAVLAPYLSQRNSFAWLDRVGVALGSGPRVDDLLDRIAQEGVLGGWPIIGRVLAQQVEHNLAGAFERCQHYIVAENRWEVTDILGERLHGLALVKAFKPTLAVLTDWRVDENPWVRRSIGVGVHVWAKRARGEAALAPQAKQLLKFLQPLFAEREIEAIKGIGWGLKTLGRYYPDLSTDWLAKQVKRQPGYRALMLKKATTYLSAAQRRRIKQV